MRVLLVGPSPLRARVRAQLNGAVDVVGEYPSLDAAEQSRSLVDAIVIADPTAIARARSNDSGERDGRGDDEGVEDPLTAREIQVLELLAEGLPNKRIAERLGISDQTVKFHVAAIAGKLGAANRTDAVRRALRRGLITL